MTTSKDFVRFLEMDSHVEGGYYKETYRSNLVIPSESLPNRFKGDRSASTHIYFLLEFGQCSKLHRIAADEHWHFYAGQTLEVYEIKKDGTLVVHKLGNRLDIGELFHTVIESGSWFGSRCMVPNSYSLVGCTVAPGFDFQDFIMADRDKLLMEFPHLESLIMELT
jgi:predicted cupin superfamily sugar epimerase